MNVLVAYESQRGHTRQAAEAIATAVRGMGHQVVIKPVEQVRTVDMEQANAVFMGTWVQGLILFGVRPAGAKKWVPALPSLKGKQVGVFCTYGVNPRGAVHALGAMFEARGAKVLGEDAFHHNHPADGAEKFVQSVLVAA